MSDYAKQQISGAICVLAVIFIVSCIGQMIPYGLAGDTGHVKKYFILMIIAVVLGLPFAVAYSYYRKSNQDED